MILPGLLVLALAVVLWFVAFAVLWLDRYKVEPTVRLVLILLWGSVCGVIVRLAAGIGPVAGFGALFAAAAAVPAGAGILEELLLALGLVLVATSHYLAGPLDGAVFGTVAGLGFAVAESFAALHAGWVPAFPAVPLFTTLVCVVATAVVGAGFGCAKLALRMRLRVPAWLAVVLVAGFARLGIMLAAGWGWARWGEANVAFNLALVAATAVLLAAVFQGVLALERRIIARQLADEVRFGVLPPWVVDVLPSYWRRIRSDWWRRRDERREIVRLLTSLAFRKHQLRDLSEERARLYGLEVGRLRQRARTLLALSSEGKPAAIDA